jgi:hypothetical protein
MHFSEEEKAMWLEDWRQSGKKAWAYARENGLIPQTFAGWAKKENKPGFVEIPEKAIRTLGQAPEILIEKEGVKIHIPLGLNRDELRAVIEGLRIAI